MTRDGAVRDGRRDQRRAVPGDRPVRPPRLDRPVPAGDGAGGSAGGPRSASSSRRSRSSCWWSCFDLSAIASIGSAVARRSSRWSPSATCGSGPRPAPDSPSSCWRSSRPDHAADVRLHDAHPGAGLDRHARGDRRVSLGLDCVDEGARGEARDRAIDGRRHPRRRSLAVVLARVVRSCRARPAHPRAGSAASLDVPRAFDHATHRRDDQDLDASRDRPDRRTTT